MERWGLASKMRWPGAADFGLWRAIRQGSVALAALCVLTATTYAQPSVSNVKIYRHQNAVVSDVQCEGIFTEEIVGTVQSGLPVLIELLYAAVADEGNQVYNGVHTFELQYNVWDDAYRVTLNDSTLALASFDAMTSLVNRMYRLPIVSLGNLQSGRDYRIRFAVQVNPLQSAGRKRIVGVVDDNVRRQSNWREQVLNVNQLITRFFSRDTESKDRSGWYETSSFNPAALREDN